MAAELKPPAYSRDILRLAASLPEPPDFSQFQLVTTRRSETCGSTVRIGVSLEEDRIDRLGAEVSACAYGQAATMLMLAHAEGRTLRDMERVLADLVGWLQVDARSLPDLPGIEALAPARKRLGRHEAVLLPFRALVGASRQAS